MRFHKDSSHRVAMLNDKSGLEVGQGWRKGEREKKRT